MVFYPMSANVYEIPDRLAKLARHFDSDDADLERKSHVIFIHLYINVTREWITYTEKTQSRDLIFCVIEKFFQKYCDYVITPIQNGTIASSPAHWQTYFELARKQRSLQSFTQFFGQLHAGAFAHIRFDLAEAIEETLAEHPEILADERALEQFYTDLIGIATNGIFGRASQIYLQSIKETIGDIQPSGIGLARHFMFLQSVWIKKIQGWRGLAWADAIDAHTGQA